MKKVRSKAVFIGVFSSILSGVVLFLILTQVGYTGNDSLDEMVSYLPFMIGPAIGFYMAKLANSPMNKQE